MREFTRPSKLSITKTTASRRWFSHFHLNTDKPFGALGFLSPDDPPLFLLPELFFELEAEDLPLAIVPALAEPL